MATPSSRTTHTLDATGKAPGRLATEVVRLLMGKHKADFAPEKDGGDIVVVAHAAQMVFSGKKIDQKEYIHHTGFPGGVKRVKAKKVFAEKPEDILRRAVSRMLPKNSYRPTRLKRLQISA